MPESEAVLKCRTYRDPNGGIWFSPACLKAEALLKLKFSCDLCGKDEAQLYSHIGGFDAWEDGLVVCEVCLNKLRNYLQATQ